jgi:predicted peptidase
MKYLKSALFCFTFFLCGNANKSFAQTSIFSREKYISGTGDTLNYRMLFPDWDTLRKYPLVIFLHGSGERGNDNESQLKFGVMHFAEDKTSSMYPAFIIAPQCPQNMRWANIYENSSTSEIHLLQPPSKPMKLLIELIQKIKKEFPVDDNRIYITGLSMGGYGTYDAIERYPQLFAAAVPVCGAGDTSKAASIANIPIWIFHGAEDPTVSPKYSLQMLEALTKAGAHPGFTQYPEVGHFSNKGVYTDPQMIAWLFRQHK